MIFQYPRESNTSVEIFVAQLMFMYSPQVCRIKVSSFYSSSVHLWKCNYYAIQIFHARLKVKILKYIVNFAGRQQYIIVKGG